MRVIRGWVDSLRAGHVNAAASYFAVPSIIQNDSPLIKLTSVAQVRAFRPDRFLERLQMKRAASLVDVGAVGRIAQDRDPGSQFPVDMRCDFVGSPVSAIHHDGHAFEIKAFGKRLFDKLDVTAFGVINAEGLAERGIGTETGSFGADMRVTIENDGPVTLVLSTDEWATRV